MSLCARRPLSFFVLAASLAAPATMAQAAVPVAHPQITVLSTTAGAHRRPGRHVRRRGRRAPPEGGVYARHAVVIDPSTDEVLYEKNAAESVPIASLSKLMTDMVFLEQKPDLDRQVEVEPEDLQGAG